MTTATRMSGMSLPQAAKVLLNRKALILACVLVAVLGAVAFTLLTPKTYLGTVALVVDPRGADVLHEDAANSQTLQSYLVTQGEIIASRNVALKVVRALRSQDRNALGDLEPLDDGAVAEQLLRQLDVKTSPNSNVLHLAAASHTRQYAAEIANAFAEAYIQTTLELQVDPARRQATWFEQQQQQLRTDLTDAQTKLSSYQRDHNILEVDEHRLDVENGRLQEISNRLVAAQSAMYEAQSRKDQLGKSLNVQDESAETIADPLLQTLKSELARSEAKFADMAQRYDRNHPLYKSSAAELEALRSRVARQTEVIKTSVSQAAELARRQVAETQAALEEQKARIIALSRQRDELAVLNRDVQSAQSAYDQALQQTNQSRLQSRLDRTNVAVLSPAEPPLAPNSPRPLLNVALGLVVGIVMGCALALYLESLTPLVRSADALAALDITILAEIPKLPRHRAPANPMPAPVGHPVTA